MSNRFRVMALLAMVLMWVSVAPKLYAKVEQRPIYICGYAVNFADSTVYLTEIQRIDTAYVESKNGFLMDRNQIADNKRTAKLLMRYFPFICKHNNRKRHRHALITTS